ncbi:potassium-transporting ATPase subunit B [Alkalilimnicola ehrlichii]|uniref:Potassium-transporting ATPase ATP-binding subunit n=1 Tax=Alkalilimnicola ehrlichii TaxID=351052 RepID=A0A3E0WWZ4_9GAMM|nr:potassium-transporting ATPase subunit KdpB [Alkalilimnicola ehrlichii]RFA30181.1 potassium-transporting ATPase subunit B [Alkalilimnicola ehrlichii]RFA37530.1 potassium-transporting ATPase subunit B [Alkalilimnicola ehrlichii]
MSKHRTEDTRLLDKQLLQQALVMSVKKLDPRVMFRNPIMFVVEVTAVFATVLFLAGLGREGSAVAGQICLWLWFTVLFANFAESLAEGRGKARADSLRQTKSSTQAKKLSRLGARGYELVPSETLRKGDLVLVEAGDTIPADGEVVDGIASVNEAAITGESAPVIRESGGDRSGVTGGTVVVSDAIRVRVTANPGDSFLDRMIGLVEGASRQKTPNEIALTILLVGLTIIFLVVVAALPLYAAYSGAVLPTVFLVALLITLIPTTIGGLLSAIGIAGMDRLVKANVVAKSGRAVEAAGDVDTLLLDKTGTITYGNRMAHAFVPVGGASEQELAEAALLSSLSDDTPEGKSIVTLARKRYKLSINEGAIAEFVPFSAQTRMSGVDLENGVEIRKGAVDSMLRYAGGREAAVSGGESLMVAPVELKPVVERISKSGGTPLVVARDGHLLGVVHLKDIVKPHIRERFEQLRAMGIRTVMVTGDNPQTAAAIAAEAGVDDFLAEATPERKLELIREEQAKGRLVAMCGDGSNDAPALAQADVGVCMNDGTAAAKEAGNLIDLDSDPTKLIEVVMIGKQLLISRGALTTFSIANDVAKYFAIIPALFMAAYPQLAALNVMNLTSPESAILAAVIFNALIIIALVPLALRGVKYRAASAGALLRNNLLVYGLGGLILPFVGIKLIDLVITGLGLV